MTPQGSYDPRDPSKSALVRFAAGELERGDRERLQRPEAVGILERYLEGFDSESSKRTMRRAAGVVARDLFDFEDGDPVHAPWVMLATRGAVTALLGYRAHLASMVEARYETREDEQPEGIATSTANQRLALLRGLVRSMGVAGLLDAGEVTRLLDRREGLRTIKRVTGAGRGGSVKQPTTHPSEQALLVKAAQDQAKPGTQKDAKGNTTPTKPKPNTAARDAALIALLSAGLRRSEAAGASWGDYGIDESTGKPTLHVRGKGAKEGKLPVALTPGIVEALAAWRKVCSNPTSGPILRRMSPRGDSIQTQGMAGDAIYRRLRALMDSAGVELRGAHSMRRAFVTELFRRGVDASIVSKLARHANVQTTLTYDRRSESEMLSQGAASAPDPFRPAA